jgi:hypothetical protein
MPEIRPLEVCIPTMKRKGMQKHLVTALFQKGLVKIQSKVLTVAH